MLGLIKLLCIFAATECFREVEHTSYIPVCERDYSEKTLEVRTELAIGCSTVNGQTVYREGKLEDIWQGNLR